MFENYVTAKTTKPRKWLGYTFTFSIIVHVIAGIALVVWSFWKIEKLVPRYVSVSFQSAAAPPPQPPPPAATHVVKKIKVTGLVQPVKQEKPEEKPEEPSTGVEGGVEGGQEGGVLGGVVGGQGEVPPPPPPKPLPPAPPKISDAEKKKLIHDYLVSKVQPTVDRHNQYPNDAQRNGIEGSVIVRLSIDVSGRLISARVVSCPDPVLCQAALQASNDSSPSPPPPAIIGTAVSVDVRSDYHLE